MPHDDPRPSARRDRHILSDIVRRCIRDVGVDAATVVVATGPQTWAPAYSSSDAVNALEQYAFTVGEGPCVDALHAHAPAISTDLSSTAAALRWPAWSKEAQQRGMRSVAAFPVQAGAVVAGALTLYSATVGMPNERQRSAAIGLADAALFGLLDLLAGLKNSDPDESDFSELLRSEVHQAAGMVMVQAQLPIELALARLRAFAFSSGRTLTEVAVDVVGRRLRFVPEDRSAQ